MAASRYRTTPSDTSGMPTGIPHIIGNEAAERFSFYGMKAVLAVFMADYLHFMGDQPGVAMSQAAAVEKVHLFNSAVYVTPFLGALLADVLFGKYRIIIWLSLVYCMGHASLALMGTVGRAGWWLFAGLALISLGSGGIKPCVSAHVGDQFGRNNQDRLSKVFNWFYFSINLGAAVSMLLTPWLLKWHGPHWAFGVPGVLMGIATLVFWMGRHRFVHAPPGGHAFLQDAFSRSNLRTFLSLGVLYFVFVAMFWALFDQTGSSWIFQAKDMDRQLLGVEWLPSQIQFINSVFVLTFIPLFAYGLYPAVSRYWPLTPLRKIGVGLFLMAAAFLLTAVIQEWIEMGEKPSIAWQILAYALLTASEVMVSITALEFAYTQAPRRMKSFLMSFYLLAVFVGNFFTAGVNHVIQVPGAGPEQKDGYDGVAGTGDDLEFSEEGRFVRSPADSMLREAADRIEAHVRETGAFPREAEGNELLEGIRDPWGQSLRYALLNAGRARVFSPGPDGNPKTRWDLGAILTLREEPAGQEQAAWLEQRKRELGVAEEPDAEEKVPAGPVAVDRFAGGQSRLEGAAYFWFFTGLMMGTAVLFVGASRYYRPPSNAGIDGGKGSGGHQAPASP